MGMRGGERVAVKADDLRVLELEEHYVSLSAVDAELLMREHSEHLTLRQASPAAGRAPEASGWLLRPGHVCGVIPLPSGRRLYIEPRTPVGNIWHLLAAAEGLTELSWPEIGSETVIGLIEGLAAIFLRETERLLQQGAVHGYRSVRRGLSTIRGRLDLREQMRRPDSLPQRFICRFDEFTIDVPENRLVVAALSNVSSGCAHSRLRARAKRCVADFQGVHASAAEEIGEIRLNSANAHYRTALTLARLILDGMSPRVGPGSRRAPGLLIHMPRLFERFVCRTVTEGLPAWLTARSNGHSVALDEERRAMLTPDAVVEREGAAVCVVDAKYRAHSASRTEPGASDLYQMMAYCMGYDAREAVLVYPYPVETPPVRIRRGASNLRVHPVGIDLSGDRRTVEAEGVRLCARIAETIPTLACVR